MYLSSMTVSVVDFALVAATIAWLVRLVRLNRLAVPLPPGPKFFPIVGGARQLLSKELWILVRKWGDQFGNVIHVAVWGQPIVFLNSRDAAFDLLDKRGAIYSDRPKMVMAGDLCGCADMVAFTGYGAQFKRQRRLFSRAFGPTHIPAYHNLIRDETLEIIRRLISTPNDWQSHIRRYAGGLALQAVYGYKPSQTNDYFLALAEECMNLLANQISPSGSVWLVDLFPFLRYIPSWAPGASFKRNARKWKTRMNKFIDEPYDYVKSSIVSGTATSAFCVTLLQDDPPQLSEKDLSRFSFDLKWTANSMYAASADTTIGVLSHFVLAMTLNPRILAEAQAEIDTVVGSARLPDFADRIHLPYVEAVFLETLRWAVPTPLGLPHRLDQDDVYEGAFIPKGSLLFANIWAMLRDEELYPQADTFMPERFLGVSAERMSRMDPRTVIFGFGRRICPGLHFVDSSAWLAVACMTATLDISKSCDHVTGNTIDPIVRYPNSVFRTPDPFQCSITARANRLSKFLQGTV